MQHSHDSKFECDECNSKRTHTHIYYTSTLNSCDCKSSRMKKKTHFITYKILIFTLTARTCFTSAFGYFLCVRVYWELRILCNLCEITKTESVFKLKKVFGVKNAFLLHTKNYQSNLCYGNNLLGSILSTNVICVVCHVECS